MIICPINKEHKKFRIHFMEFYDSDLIVDQELKPIQDKRINPDSIDNEMYAAKIAHCYRCVECESNDEEWDDKTFFKFQKNVEKEFKHTSTARRLLNQIMNIVDGVIPDNCPECGGSIFNIGDEWRCEDQRCCCWNKKE